ncbi:MAG: hypothetical protein EAZ20_08860 [Bacteroidetes bacterium]|nr:MAG: hypothetical protein EAZ20_08860 [Bacteroidota bacterium]
MVLIFALFILTGCPYSATVPIDTPSIAINKKLIGKWVKDSEGTKPEEAEYLVFSQSNANTYKIEKYTFDTEKKEHKLDQTYEGHFSKVGKYDFFNMKTDDKYYFYKIEYMNGNDLKMFEVTDNIDETFDNSAALKAFFQKHADLTFFYNKDESKYKRN